MVKKLKRLIFSRNPVGQEEKQGKARFPLAVLFDCRAIDEQGGRGEVGARHKERTYSTNKKTHQNGTTGCIKYQYFVSLYGNKILSLQH